MAYQLSEQHFPVAVPFHSLEEVAAQTAVSPALTTTPKRISVLSLRSTNEPTNLFSHMTLRSSRECDSVISYNLPLLPCYAKLS